ncbi:hypothetical protein LGN44_20585 [Burkholderia cepacia]|uniref:hypothetical protein n=1 Tax=Burkholderia cepacia TaxID=292 RepID=UPI001C3792C3|nr:hypothetical protein [Burkholderia cepacia]MCA8343903.1 hypothetical protein [Burkholderia cepacia]
MAKKILTVGVELASDEVQYEQFTSKVSLLDWDIFIFRPTLDDFIRPFQSTFNGKTSLNETLSFQLKECSEHWRREILQAYEAGKTVIVHLPPLKEVYVDTGERQHSGTGRNQKTTTVVKLTSNFDTLPTPLSPVSTQGSEIKLADKGAEVLATYWSEYGAISRYNVVLDGKDVPAALVTRSGAKVVGALYRDNIGPGVLVLLPDIDFAPDDFFITDEDDDELAWTEKANQFAARYIYSIIALDKALRADREVTPEPAWASEERFALTAERSLKLNLLSAEREIEEAQKKKEKISDELREAGALRSLLYEKGHALEAVLLKALRALGFTAENYKDNGSEFDVVFECAEGRLIGEVEGKDSKAVNVDKLRQLAMNIHEDLMREEVAEPAKPVLFGNGYRLQPPDERDDPFTDKCHAAAATSSTALVATADLFGPVQYISGEPDAEYARMCRLAILNSNGRVTFPPVPRKDDEPSESITSEIDAE